MLAALCLLLIAPLAIIDVPPLLDYPNHLARVFLLDALPRDTTLGQFYAVRWSIIPNLAVDLIGTPLVAMFPVHVAGRILIALSVLLPVCGAVAYGRALGSRWWPMGAGLVAYNATELHGFLNFSIAIGLAMLLAATWLRWRDSRPVLAIALSFAGTPVLFVCHLMGLVFFGFLAAGAELHAVWCAADRTTPSDPPRPDLIRPSTPGRWSRGAKAERGPEAGAVSARPVMSLLRHAFRRGMVLTSVFVIPAVLYLSSVLRQLGGDAVFLPPGAKLAELLSPFVNYSDKLDWLTTTVVVGSALRWGRMPAPAAITSLLLLAVFLAAPFAWKETFGLDTRFAIMLGFMLFAGIKPVPPPKAVPVALAFLLAARMALLCAAWADQRQDLADLRAVLAPVQPGQAVYVAEAGLHEAPTRWSHILSNGTRTDEHLPALILMEHRAYWPFEFDTPSQQPIETREPYRGMAERIGSLPDWATAAHANVCGFDYVLLTGAVPDLPAIRFRKLVQSGHAALYAIIKCKEEPS